MAEEGRIFVRVREHTQQFTKDLVNYPPDTPEHRDDPRTVFRVNIHGYDELGRPVMPIFEVENCREIENAIHNDLRRDPRPQTDPNRKADGMLIPSRLVQVFAQDAKHFVKWYGHPTLQMNPADVYKRVQNIRAEQPKGDKILGLPDDQPSRPYSIAAKSDDPPTKELFALYEQGRQMYYVEHDGQMPDTDTDAIPAAWEKLLKKEKVAA